jgi:hypothetical protein
MIVYNFLLYIAIQFLISSNSNVEFIFANLNALYLAFNSNNNIYDFVIVCALYADTYFELNYKWTFFLVYELLDVIDFFIFIFNIYLQYISGKSNINSKKKF